MIFFPVDTVVLTSRAHQLTLALVTVQLWYQELVSLTRTWSLYSSILQVCLGLFSCIKYSFVCYNCFVFNQFLNPIDQIFPTKSKIKMRYFTVTLNTDENNKNNTIAVSYTHLTLPTILLV